MFLAFTSVASGSPEGVWRLDFGDQGAPTVAPDSSGNGYSGQSANGQAFAYGPGKFGDAITVGANGAANGFTVSNAPLLAPASSPVSVVAWVKASQSPGPNKRILSKGAIGCAGVGAYGLYTGANGGLDFGVAIQSNNAFGYYFVRTPPISPSTIWDGNWHAIVGVYDAHYANSRDLIGLWVDGQQVAATDLGNPTGVLSYGSLTDSDFYVGHTSPGEASADCNANYDFTGSIDEVRVYDEVLEANRIQMFATYDAYGSPPPDREFAPTNITRPTLSGRQRPGSVLTCSEGTWTDDNDSSHSTSITWERAPAGTHFENDPAWHQIKDDQPNAEPIPHTGPSYTVQDSDAGSLLRCRVGRTDFESSTTEAVSNTLEIFARKPVNVTPPTVVGLPAVRLASHDPVGHAVECDPGKWQNNPEFRYQWLRDGRGIRDATGRFYVVKPSRGNPGFSAIGRIIHPDGDGNHRLSCRVQGVNSLGRSRPVTSASVLAIDWVPYAYAKPAIYPVDGNEPFDPQHPEKRELACSTGLWWDDYAALGIQPYAYTYQWQRNGVPIAGATQRTYQPTSDDFGRNLTCRVYNTNPLGKGTAVSNKTLIHLPVGLTNAWIYREGGTNPADPMNLYAISAPYQNAIAPYVLDKLRAGRKQRTDECAARSDIPSGLPPRNGSQTQYNDVQICQILLHDPDNVKEHEIGGVRWDRTPGCCPSLRIEVPSVDPDKPPVEDPAAIEKFAHTAPKTILWDLDGDGITDAACPGSAPVLRTIFNPQHFTPRAVIVNRDDTYYEKTTDFNLAQYVNHSTEGVLRDNQVKVCSTSFDPPPIAQLPCVTHAEIGRAQLNGNLCPIDARQIDPNDFAGLLDDDLKQFLINASEQKLYKEGQVAGASLKRGAPAAHTHWVEWKGRSGNALRSANSFAFHAAAGAWANNFASVSAFDSPTHVFNVEQPHAKQVLNALQNKVQEFTPNLATFATDQIYVLRGDPLTINGITVDAAKNVATMLIPSDVHAALGQVKSMTLASLSASTSFGSLDTPTGIPLSDPTKIKAVLPDAPSANDAYLFAKNEGGKVLKDGLSTINLDDLKSKVDKLDLGPFKLSGGVDVKLEKDGTATLHAFAELPWLKTGAKGEKERNKARADIELHGDKTGKITFQGVKFQLSRAYLGAVGLEDLLIDYNRLTGLMIHGKILVPVSPSFSIDINNLAFDEKGAFKELDVEFVGGPATSIPLGDLGLYITELGLGVRRNAGSENPIDHVHGSTTLAVGPAPGGGCSAAAGLRADFDADFASPFKLQAKMSAIVACIEMGKLTFYVDGDGKVHVHGDAHFSAGPAYLSANADGWFDGDRLWQVAFDGTGGIKGITDEELHAAISNLGAIVCGKISLGPLKLKAGVGLHFVHGLPPLDITTFIANLDLHVFDGCDVGPYKPLGDNPGFRAAAVAKTTFTIKKGTGPSVISIYGVGGAPRVRLRSPQGQVYDFTNAAGNTGKHIGTVAWGTNLDLAKKTIVVLRQPAAGKWTVDTTATSPKILRMQRADVLPPPRVSGNVTGNGATRVLHYNVKPHKGQSVRFSEVAPGTHHVLRTITTGGKGAISFVVADAHGKKRSIEADVLQNGLPREVHTIARFTAGNPQVGKARNVRIRRKGHNAIVTWKPGAFASGYDMTVTWGAGRRLPFFPKRGSFKLVVPNVQKGEGLKVEITSISAGGRLGPTTVATLSGSMRYGGRADRKKKGKH